MATMRGAATAQQARGTRAPRRPRPVVYPDSDGKPMGETELHRDEMWRLIYLLQAYFAAHRDLHVTGNLILYYEEGNPRVSIVPDVMVIKGIPSHRRDTYLLWEEGEAPCFVIEVTSKSTRRVDEGRKRDLYAWLGVREYVLYDPRFPGLETPSAPLRGYRLGAAGYEPIAPDAAGGLRSAELGLRLVLEAGRLQFYAVPTGERLLSVTEREELAGHRAQAEAERADLEAERADLEAERADLEAERADLEAEARRAAEARVAELEALLREQQPPSA